MGSEKRKTSKIVLLRLSDDELLKVESRAGGDPLSAYVKARVFGSAESAGGDVVGDSDKSEKRDNNIPVRVTPEQHHEITIRAQDADLSLSNFVRHKVMGYRIAGKKWEALSTELMRSKGLAKLVHIESKGGYEEVTGEIVNVISKLVMSISQRKNDLPDSDDYSDIVELRTLGIGVKSSHDSAGGDRNQKTYQCLLNVLDHVRDLRGKVME